MLFGIHLKIKFRFFFRDIYKIDKAWEVLPMGIVEVTPEEPVNAKIVYNEHGVRLAYWSLQ